MASPSFSYINPKGYVRVYDLATGNKLPIPNSDLGASGLESNFGNGFVQYFRVQNSVPPVSVEELEHSSYALSIYPNPAKDAIYINVISNT